MTGHQSIGKDFPGQHSSRQGRPTNRSIQRLTLSPSYTLEHTIPQSVVGWHGTRLGRENRAHVALQDPTPSYAILRTYIHYDGVVPRTESDEYVEITNEGTVPQDLEDWRLVDISEGYPEFRFPTFVLEPGRSIRVYTNEIHPEWGGFSFESGRAVWNNSDSDVAVLYDNAGEEVSRRSY